MSVGDGRQGVTCCTPDGGHVCFPIEAELPEIILRDGRRPQPGDRGCCSGRFQFIGTSRSWKAWGCDTTDAGVDVEELCDDGDARSDGTDAPDGGIGPDDGVRPVTIAQQCAAMCPGLIAISARCIRELKAADCAIFALSVEDCIGSCSRDYGDSTCGSKYIAAGSCVTARGVCVADENRCDVTYPGCEAEMAALADCGRSD